MHIYCDMKKIPILLILVLVYKVHGQKLLQLNRNVNGSVIPSIQSSFFIDPSKPISKTNYPHNTGTYCKDSLIIGRYLSNDSSDSTINWVTQVCADNYSIPFSHFGDHENILNCADPIENSGIDISDESNWAFTGNAWHYSRTVYRDGSYHYNLQTWQLDEKGKIKTIKHKNEFGKTTSILTYYYSNDGSLKRISYNLFQNENHGQVLQQREWFYDQKHRPSIMISYQGPYRQFTPQVLRNYKRELEQSIRKGCTDNRPLMDSSNIQQLLMYNYGAFGLEQVNCYHNEEGTYDNTHLLSDSLFYDVKGRIARYKGGITTHDLQKEMNFTYDSFSGLLTKIIGHHYSSHDEYWTDDKIVQELTYGLNNKLTSLKESHFIVSKNYVNGAWTEPQERYFEGSYFFYKYLH